MSPTICARACCALAALALSGCASSSGPRASEAWLDPVEAIQAAATAAPEGVPGTFDMVVRATGRQDGNIYLNSETDYRDQRNLTIAIPAKPARQLRERFGEEADRALIGKRIMVDGVARRVRIGFTYNGRPTDKYYYQTHVRLDDAAQLAVAD